MHEVYIPFLFASKIPYQTYVLWLTYHTPIISYGSSSPWAAITSVAESSRSSTSILRTGAAPLQPSFDVVTNQC
jgi:hypothetical protein